MNNMDAIILMMSDSYGQYIPVNFLNDVDRRDWHINQNDAAVNNFCAHLRINRNQFNSLCYGVTS